jgi:molecular chaperone GrpE
VTESEEFTAAAPPDRDAKGTGETSFADADAPPASERAAWPEGHAGEESAGADSSDVEQDLDALIARAKERDEYLALAQRTQADFENYRKRMAREVAQATDRGMAKVTKELLPALDHLELALKAASTQPTSSSDPESGHEDVVKGFTLVREEFFNALAKVGIQPFSPAGEPFDPNEHEAMASQPAEDAESGTVVEVYQQGYRLNGAVLRPARVVVAQ